VFVGNHARLSKVTDLDLDHDQDKVTNAHPSRSVRGTKQLKPTMQHAYFILTLNVKRLYVKLTDTVDRQAVLYHKCSGSIPQVLGNGMLLLMFLYALKIGG